MINDVREVVRCANEAYEAAHSLNHVTSPPASLPAPTVYKVLGNLKGLGRDVPLALSHLAAGLQDSLKSFEVYEDSGADPKQSVAAASVHLTRAAALAAQLGEELEQAQTAVAGQGYRQSRALRIVPPTLD